MKKVLALLLIALVAVPLTASAKLKVGDPMVPFVLPTDDGKTVDSATLVGKGPIVLNFMNTVCSTCVAEMNEIKKFQAEGSKVQYFPIAVDMRGADSVRQFKTDMGYSWTFLLDPKFETARKYNAASTPFTVIIGNDGKVTGFIAGYNEEDKKALADAFTK